jgi:diadenosine tetraphosphate (Ap4A) HIT family hydrolase
MCSQLLVYVEYEAFHASNQRWEISGNDEDALHGWLCVLSAKGVNDIFQAPDEHLEYRCNVTDE